MTIRPMPAPASVERGISWKAVALPVEHGGWGLLGEPILIGLCLAHQGKAPFEAVKSHHTVAGLLQGSAMSCLNCHGRPHPTRQARTPGSPEYANLMRPVTIKE